MTFRFTTMLACLCLLAGCNSTGVGNPGVDSISLAITVDDQDSEPADAAAPDAEEDPDQASLPHKTVRHAILVLREVRWLACEADQKSVTITGPFVVNLITGESTPAIPPVTEIPLDGFCGIDAPLTAATSPAALLGRSLFFDGTRSDGALFIVYADMKATLRMRAKHELRWEKKPNQFFFWAFRPRRWLQRRELDMADSTAWDGQMHAVVFDVDRHPLLYMAIRKRLAGESTLYFDREPNHELDRDDPEIGIGSEDVD